MTEREFWLSKGRNKTGPFTRDELVKMRISEDDYIWWDGLDDWIPVSEVNFLKNKIKKSPPPPPKKNRELKFVWSVGKFLKSNSLNYIATLILILMVSFLLGGGAKSDYELTDGSTALKYPIYGKTAGEIRWMFFYISIGLSIAVSSLIWLGLAIFHTVVNPGKSIPVDEEQKLSDLENDHQNVPLEKDQNLNSGDSASLLGLITVLVIAAVILILMLA